MKTLLIIDSSLGLATGYLAKNITTTAAASKGLTLTENLAEADRIIVAGKHIPTDGTLDGKAIYLADIEQLLQEPAAVLEQAQSGAKVWHAPATADLPARSGAAAAGPKRIVAVTACPTGVAHTFMAAEAIDAEAKKRGWWVKVETRGSVGAGNAITPEEVAAADLVIVAADIDVDLAKFAGKPMYRTSTSLALKKPCRNWTKP